MKDRIEGWTQMDEDLTFGLNGLGCVWEGDEPPSLEEQRGLKLSYCAIDKAMAAGFLPWAESRYTRTGARKVPPATPESILAAVDAHLQEADEAGYFTGAPIDGMTGFIMHEDGRRERWGK